MYATNTDPFVSRIFSLKLNHLRWVKDVFVSGTGTIPRADGRAVMNLTVGGSGTDPGQLRVTWHSRADHAIARVTGTIGGPEVSVYAWAPSYY